MTCVRAVRSWGGALAVAALLLGAATWTLAEPARGAVVLVVGPAHGVHVGDLPAVWMLAAAAAIVAHTVWRPLGAWLVGLGVLTVGWLLDAVASPSGTVLGPTLLAAALVAAGRPVVRRATSAALAALVAVDLLAVADVGGIDVLLATRGGGWTRTLALGALLAVVGAAELMQSA